MRTQGNIWLLQVFGSELAAGNPTGIVILDRPRRHEEMQRLAARIGYPDTGFVSRQDDKWSIVSFSPAEHLAFCSQTTLALGAMLGQLEAFPKAAPIEFASAAGAVVIEADAREQSKYWVHLDVETAHTIGTPEAICQLLGIAARHAGPEIVVGFGRKRAYVALESADALYAARPSAEAIMSYCERRGVNGVCPFVLIAPARILFRTFTTSLLGAEDAATGGAVAALPAYFEATGRCTDTNEWQVEQGSGPALKRGRLFLRRRARGGHVAIGGEVKVLSIGDLSDGAWL